MWAALATKVTGRIDIVWEMLWKQSCNQYSVQNHIQHDRIEHIEIDPHFLKEEVTSSTLSLLHVPSETQLVNVLTKGLNERDALVCKFGMWNTFAPTWGQVSIVLLNEHDF